MRNSQASIVAAALLLLAGCAGDDAGAPSAQLTTTGALPATTQTQAANQAPVAGQARLTISRVSGVLYAGAPATVKVNGQTVADIWAGSATVVPVPAGRVKVSVEAWSSPGAYTVDLDVKEGAGYALEIAPRQESFLPGALLGPIGALIDASNNEGKSGPFRLRVVTQDPAKPAEPARRG